MPDPHEKMYYAFDFDGVLAEHYWPQDGEYNHKRCGSPIKPMVDLVKGLLADGQECRILTARVGPVNYRAHDAEEAREAIELWCEEHIGQRLIVQCHKDYLMKYLFDDRAVGVLPNSGKVILKWGVVDAHHLLEDFCQ